MSLSSFTYKDTTNISLNRKKYTLCIKKRAPYVYNELTFCVVDQLYFYVVNMIRDQLNDHNFPSTIVHVLLSSKGCPKC